MSQAPHKTDLAFLALVAIAVLLALYVGAYYATVESWPTYGPENLAAYRWIEPSPLAWDSDQDRSRWSTFFAPIHQFDRRIRPKVWRP